MDNQTLMTRRLIAGGALLVLAILLIFGFRGCLDQRKERALKDYVGDVDSLVADSNQNGRDLFSLLSDTGGQDQDVELVNQLNTLRTQSAQVYDRGQELERPEEAADAHEYLVEMLRFRRDGLARIADALPNARAQEQRREGTQEVAAQMQAFLASDVLFTQRVIPSLQGTLRNQEILGEVRLPRSQFLPDIEWLQPAFVARRVRGLPGDGGGGGGADEDAAPGLHGNGVTSATLGGQALTPGASVSIPVSEDLEMEVQIANQGENTETDVPVRVTIGRGDDAVELEETLDTIAAGETKTVTVPVSETPPTGQNVPVRVEVEPVPGEEQTENNEQTYQAIFTR